MRENLRKQTFDASQEPGGDHLRRARIQRNLSQATIARDLAVSETTVHLWETNQRQPKAYLVPQIIDFLGYAPWTPPNEFGAWLYQVRRALGLSRRKLAIKLSVDESTVCRWEAHVRPIGLMLDRLREILAAFAG